MTPFCRSLCRSVRITVLQASGCAVLAVVIAVLGGINAAHAQGYVKLSAYGEHSCGVTSDGAVRCWGSNFRGIFAPASGSGTPLAIAGIGSATDVGTGAAHACALLVDGQVRCWGKNDQGQLGNGSLQDSITPVTVGNIDNAISLGIGAEHSCALLASGYVQCWGSNNSGQRGPSTTPQYFPGTVGNLENASAVVAGESHSCALLASGEVKCWGSNYSGQAGLGYIGGRSENVGSVVNLSGAVALSAGSHHTCAVLSGGAARCWGANSSGQLGDGSKTNRGAPVDVVGVAGAVTATASRTQIELGPAHSCAVLSDGTARCWGQNDVGQLGDGTTTSSTISVRVNGINHATLATAGGAHSCAALTSGGVQCWGDNRAAQLGNGYPLGSGDPIRSQPTPIAVTDIANAVSIGVGPNQACAVLADGTVYCWGGSGTADTCFERSGADGAVYCFGGSGDIVDDPRPTRVGNIDNAISVSVGAGYACAVLASGYIQCWGNNADGQLGDGTTLSRALPGTVIGISDAVAVSASKTLVTYGHNMGASPALRYPPMQHTCALLRSGLVKCWGADFWRQVSGPPSPIEDAAAVSTGGAQTCALSDAGSLRCRGLATFNRLFPIPGPYNYTFPPYSVGDIARPSVSAGIYHRCVVVGSGQVYCWGAAELLGLGDNPPCETYTFPRGEVSDSAVACGSPTRVVGISSAIAVSAAYQHTCVLLSSGGVQCFGSNASGQLGRGPNPGGSPPSSAPASVIGINNATQVSVGGDNSCALLQTGQVSCWGGFAPVVATSLRQVPRFATIPSYIAQPCSFDVDGDGQLSVASDGIAVIRTLIGFVGTAVSAPITSQNATRTTWPEIRSYLSQVCQVSMPPVALEAKLQDGSVACTFDIDGDGKVAALTDGLIMIRSLLGLTGDAVTTGAIGAQASRTNWPAIRTYLAETCKVGDLAP